MKSDDSQTYRVGVVEHVVGDVDIRRTPAELPGVGSEHEDVEAGLPGPVQQRQSLQSMVVSMVDMSNGRDAYQFIVVSHVQLEETRASSLTAVGTVIVVHTVALVLLRRASLVGSGDGLDGLRRSGRQAVLQTDMMSLSTR